MGETRTHAIAMLLALVFAAPAMGRSMEPSVPHARALSWEGEFEAALAEYDSVLSAQPTPGQAREARLGRARVLGWLGRHDDALVPLESMLDSNPEDPETLVLRARVLGWMKRYAEAEADVRRALTLAPTYREGYLVLGDVLVWSQRRDEARAAYEEVLLLEPDSPDVLERLRRLEAPPVDRRIRVEFGLRFDSLDADRRDWWREDLQVAFRGSSRTTLYSGFTHYNRYEEDDYQGSLGVSYAAPHGWWLGAGATLGPESDVVARYAFNLEVARRLHERATLQIRYRRSWYDGDVETDAVTPGFEIRPFDQLILGMRYHLTRVSGGRLGHAGSLQADFSPEQFPLGAYAAVSYGTEVFAPSTVQTARKRARTVSVAAGLRWRHESGIGLRLGYAYQDLRDTYTRHGVESGVWIDF